MELAEPFFVNLFGGDDHPRMRQDIQLIEFAGRELPRQCLID